MKEAKELVQALIAGLHSEEGKTMGSLVEAWKHVSGDAGTHSRVIDMRFNAVVVEVDHPARIQLLRMKERELLSQLRARSGVRTVRRIAFRLGEGTHTREVRVEKPDEEELAQLRALVQRLRAASED